ncbi:two-component system sensor histidine kinase NtrB [Desulfovibrio litoralis]|uniref:histidine kinase n=1 Tax=Desulfovibrio litoralis DSM 11393 TaxID=1121455 RepID=A0A1M7SC01_9BACT|nr:ATP-binding protein [Desulfovibrio litoralis]SHN55772.1 PAS domain S-box-containing protein [Desulfovibrio litoralis DSM 11393]
MNKKTATLYDKDDSAVIKAGIVCKDGIDLNFFGSLNSLYLTSRKYQILPHFEILGLILNNAELPETIVKPLGNSRRYTTIKELVEKEKDIEILFFLGYENDPLPTFNKIISLQLESFASFMKTLIHKLSHNGILAQTERMVGSIIDHLNEVFLILSPDGIIINLNKAALHSVGGSKNQYIGKNFKQIESTPFCPVENLEPCPFEECIKTKKHVERNLSFFNAEGEIVYFRVHVSPILNYNGEIVRVFLMRRDVTTQVVLQQEEQISKRISNELALLHQITHELRNPLFVIGGFANSLLKNQELSESAQNKVQAILDESQRLDGLISRLSEAIKPISPKQGIVFVNELIKEVVGHYQKTNTRENLIIKTDLHDGLAKVKGDSELLRQCLSELIDNARNAIADSGIITIRSRQISGTVKIQVTDTGKGIAPERIPQLFNPLLRKNKEKSGLILIKKALEEMGGGINVQSLESRGTTITLNLKPIPTS